MRIGIIGAGMTESRWVETRLGRPVVKAFNNIYFKSLLEKGRPTGAPGRIALPVAGDGERDREIVLRLIDERRHFTDPDNARLAKRLRKQRRHLLTFLEDGHAGLEATNNRAERMLRPGVITRKTGGCNRSHTGARTHAVMASVLVSLHLQGRDLLGYLSAALLAPGLPPRLSSAPAPAPP